jgi:hypothetical protein
VVSHGAAPGEVFTAVAAEIADLLKADLTLIGRYETDATLSYLAAGGPMQALSPLGDRLKLGGDNLASKILHSGQPESMSYDNASGPFAAVARRLALRNAVGTPILVDGQIWGAMFAGWRWRSQTEAVAVRPASVTSTRQIAPASESASRMTRAASRHVPLRSAG